MIGVGTPTNHAALNAYGFPPVLYFAPQKIDLSADGSPDVTTVDALLSRRTGRRPSATLGLSSPERESLTVVLIFRRVARFVLNAAPGVLELAFGLVGLTLALHLLIAEQLASSFLHLAAYLLGAAFGAIV